MITKEGTKIRITAKAKAAEIVLPDVITMVEEKSKAWEAAEQALDMSARERARVVRHMKKYGARLLKMLAKATKVRGERKAPSEEKKPAKVIVRRKGTKEKVSRETKISLAHGDECEGRHFEDFKESQGIKMDEHNYNQEVANV